MGLLPIEDSKGEKESFQEVTSDLFLLPQRQ